MKNKLIVLLSFLLALLAWNTSVCAQEIKTLSQFPLSGVAGSLPEFGMGFIDGTKWVNEEGEGCNGKKITYYMEDFRYDATLEVANFNKYTSEHSKDELLMATGYMTGGLKPLISKVNVEEKIPWLDGSYSTEIFGAEGGPTKYPYYYSLGATYGDQMKILMKWIKENHKAEGTPRVGFVFSPTGWGRDGTPEGIAYAKEIGLDVVAEIEMPFSATDATREATELRKAKAQYVLHHGFPGSTTTTSVFFKTVRRYVPDAIIMGTHYTTGRFPILVAQEAYDGYIGASTRPFMDAVPRSETPMDNAYVRMVHDFAKKYRPDDYKEKGKIKDMFLYGEGVTYAFLLQEALKRADNAGELTREGVKKALDNMVWDFKGMFDGKSFAYKSHTIPMVRIYKAQVKMVKDGGKPKPTGTLIPLTEWINLDEIKW
jgi:hypothetical protein